MHVLDACGYTLPGVLGATQLAGTVTSPPWLAAARSAPWTGAWIANWCSDRPSALAGPACPGTLWARPVGGPGFLLPLTCSALPRPALPRVRILICWRCSVPLLCGRRSDVKGTAAEAPRRPCAAGRSRGTGAKSPSRAVTKAPNPATGGMTWMVALRVRCC